MIGQFALRYGVTMQLKRQWRTMA